MQTFFQRLIRAALVLSVILALLPAPAVRAAGPICYVKADATGANNGTSWADAYTTLQDALADAGCTEIWVAAGVYYPDEGAGQTNDDRNSTFRLKNGVALYGGFAGTETARDQRDPEHNITVLSGDIDQNDTTDAHGVVTSILDLAGNNAYHVLTAIHVNNGAVLDGFTITAGQANDEDFYSPKREGGGLHSEHSSLTLRNVTFSGNLAYDGAGIFSVYSSHKLTHVTFSDNHAYLDGGGMYEEEGSPILTEVTFSRNEAEEAGGGMIIGGGSPQLTNVIFSNNDALYDGGGIASGGSNLTLKNVTFSGNSVYGDGDGGGISNYGGSLTLTDVTFSGNSAAFGGGMLSVEGSPVLTNVTFMHNAAVGFFTDFLLFGSGGGLSNYKSNPRLTNVTFFGNSAYDYGGGIENFDSSPVLTNVTFSNNSAHGGDGDGMYNSGQSKPVLINVIIANSGSGGDCVNFGPNSAIADTSSHNLIEDSAHACGLTDGVNGNIIGKDPQLGALTDFGGPGRQVFPLKSGSPAIDAGADNECPSTDQRGVARPQGSHCDIGAYEVRRAPLTVTVNQAATQPDPTNVGPIHFTAVFTPFVDPATFDASDVTLGGTVSGTLSATVTEISPYDHTTFDIAVSGMSGAGTVTASIAANRVADWDGNPNNASTSTDNTVTYDAAGPTVVSPPVTSAYTQGFTSFQVHFSEAVNDPPGNTGPNDVTNPANYLLVERGKNDAFDTVSCAGGVQADDTRITVNSVTYDSATFTATAHINNGVPLPDGTYRLFVCGTTSITDLVGNHLNGGHDSIYDFVVQHPAPPKTGFPRGVVTTLPQQPATKAYAGMDMRLTIPSLGLGLPIVGVPLTENGWDVSWLGNAVGWLEGTAFPTWAGNTVLTAHVWNADNTPGPFLHLKDLRYGDRIEIHAWGRVYVYEVRENKRLSARSWAAHHMLLKHEKYDVLTLVTCEGYDPATGDYPFRRMVRAVLVAVR